VKTFQASSQKTAGKESRVLLKKTSKLQGRERLTVSATLTLSFLSCNKLTTSVTITLTFSGGNWFDDAMLLANFLGANAMPNCFTDMEVERIGRKNILFIDFERRKEDWMSSCCRDVLV
jgi:hypothetical protein